MQIVPDWLVHELHTPMVMRTTPVVLGPSHQPYRIIDQDEVAADGRDIDD
jgi:hypothetical protein